MSNIEMIELDIRELSKEERENFTADLKELLEVHCTKNNAGFEWIPVGKSIPVPIISMEIVNNV